MIADALKLLFETGQAAKAVRVLDQIPGDGRICYVEENGQIREIPVTPLNRCHQVGQLDDIIELARTAAETTVANAGNEITDVGTRKCKPVVWYGPEAVTLVYDDEDRCDTAVMRLNPSPQLEVLLKLEKEMPLLDHKQFIQLLRLQLGMPAEIVNPFRKLDWHTAATAAGSVQRGRDSLGKTIEAKLQGIDQLPETLAVLVPIYDVVGERDRQSVECSVEIDPGAERLTLMPLPAEISEACDRALRSIAARLAPGLDDLEIPIYLGAP